MFSSLPLMLARQRAVDVQPPALPGAFVLDGPTRPHTLFAVPERNLNFSSMRRASSVCERSLTERSRHPNVRRPLVTNDRSWPTSDRLPAVMSSNFGLLCHLEGKRVCLKMRVHAYVQSRPGGCGQ